MKNTETLCSVSSEGRAILEAESNWGNPECDVIFFESHILTLWLVFTCDRDPVTHF